MDLTQLANVGEFIGGVAVLLTLIFLVVEVRRNTTASRRATQQSQVEQVITVNQHMGELAGLIAKANEGHEGLAADERIQLQMLYTNYFNLWDTAYWNWRDGFLDEHGFSLWNNGIAGIMRGQVASRSAWSEIGHFYSSEFRQHADELIASLGPVSGTGTMV